MTDVKVLTAALSEPFAPGEVQFKPQSVKGNRALAMAYVSARVVQDRLDAVVGVENWQDEYQTLADGSVVCKLSVRLGGGWVSKTDVGGPSEQPDGGDRMKAAFSDALKRAAVKFGVGRYLYRLPAVWADYDPQRRCFTAPPALPAHALPARAKPPGPPAPVAKAQPPKPAGPVEDNPHLQVEYLAEIAACPDPQAMAGIMARVQDDKRDGKLSENDLAPLRRAVGDFNKAHPAAVAGAGK